MSGNSAEPDSLRQVKTRALAEIGKQGKIHGRAKITRRRTDMLDGSVSRWCEQG